MKRLLTLITACMTCTYISAGQEESFVQEALKTRSATSNVPGFTSKTESAPSGLLKAWNETNNVAKTLTTTKDKQKFEALLAAGEAILDGQQVQQQKQRFNSTWKALSDQLGRAHYGLSPSAWFEGISWRDRLVGINAALQYILGRLNAHQTYAANEKTMLIAEISELISKTSSELNK